MEILKRSKAGWLVICASLLLAVGTACSGDDDDNGNTQDQCTNEGEALEINGTWSTNFGSTLNVTNETWATTSSSMGTTEMSIVSYDNCENRLVAGMQSSYSKIVWTEPSGGEFWYCTPVFNEGSAEAAREAEVSVDYENPGETGSCGDGFAFTRATEGGSSPDAGMNADTGKTTDGGS